LAYQKHLFIPLLVFLLPRPLKADAAQKKPQLGQNPIFQPSTENFKQLLIKKLINPFTSEKKTLNCELECEYASIFSFESLLRAILLLFNFSAYQKIFTKLFTCKALT